MVGLGTKEERNFLVQKKDQKTFVKDEGKKREGFTPSKRSRAYIAQSIEEEEKAEPCKLYKGEESENNFPGVFMQKCRVS